MKLLRVCNSCYRNSEGIGFKTAVTGSCSLAHGDRKRTTSGTYSRDADQQASSWVVREWKILGWEASHARLYQNAPDFEQIAKSDHSMLPLSSTDLFNLFASSARFVKTTVITNVANTMMTRTKSNSWSVGAHPKWKPAQVFSSKWLFEVVCLLVQPANSQRLHLRAPRASS